jgi:hypothetical protein
MFHLLRHVLHPLRILWSHRTVWFWQIWFTETALAALFTAWFVLRGETDPLHPVNAVEQPRLRKGNRPAAAALILLALCLAGFTALSLVWEDFTYYDNSHYTNETLLGRNIPLQISAESGRFWPLGHQEFNLLRHFTHTIVGYHGFRVVQLLLICAILLVLDKALGLRERAALIIVLLVVPGIVISFTGLIYAEANLIFWLALFLWSIERIDAGHSLSWSVVAVLSAQFLLYYKEPCFLLLLTFAGCRIVFRRMECGRLRFNRGSQVSAKARLDLCLILLAVFFFAYYLATAYSRTHHSYAEDSQHPLLQLIVTYLEIDLLAWIFAGVTAVRLVLIVRKKLSPSPFWDSLAIAGLVYFSSFIALRMESSYYLVPVDFIAVLYLGRILALSCNQWAASRKVLAYGLLCIVLAQCIALSAFRIYERKNVVHAKALMARVIKSRFDGNAAAVKRLYFPFANTFDVLEFASYLNYLGMPIQQTGDDASEHNGVALVASTATTDGPCGYRTFLCHPGTSPQAGDLILVFPDDPTSEHAIGAYRQQGSDVLLAYTPYPAIPSWIRPLVDRLHVESPEFAFSPLPDSWLTASVTVWK